MQNIIRIRLHCRKVIYLVSFNSFGSYYGKVRCIVMNVHRNMRSIVVEPVLNDAKFRIHVSDRSCATFIATCSSEVRRKPEFTR